MHTAAIPLSLGGQLQRGIRDSRRPELVRRETTQPWGPTLRALVPVWPILALIVAVLGSLFAGIATPTESAAVGVAAAVVLGFTKGHLTWAGLSRTFLNSARAFAVIAFVFLGAVVLAQSISLMQLPQKLLETHSSTRPPLPALPVYL